MILELGINRVAKQVSSQDFRDGLQNLKSLANQANAADKEGSFAASAQIVILALIISGLVYSLTLAICPKKNLVKYLQENKILLSEKYKPIDNMKGPSEKDIMDMIYDLMTWGFGGGSVVGGGVIYYRKKQKAARQRAMEQAMQEEMDRLKKQLEEEINENATSAAGATDKKSSILSGANIVELFKSFTDIMTIQGDLPRQQEETALEYFDKVSETINFPKEESEKAARYFDDELYGKKNSTQEDKAAFMKLVLEMISRCNKKMAKK